MNRFILLAPSGTGKTWYVEEHGFVICPNTGYHLPLLDADQLPEIKKIYKDAQVLFGSKWWLPKVDTSPSRSRPVFNTSTEFSLLDEAWKETSAMKALYQFEEAATKFGNGKLFVDKRFQELAKSECFGRDGIILTVEKHLVDSGDGFCRDNVATVLIAPEIVLLQQLARDKKIRIAGKTNHQPAAEGGLEAIEQNMAGHRYYAEKHGIPIFDNFEEATSYLSLNLLQRDMYRRKVPSSNGDF